MSARARNITTAVLVTAALGLGAWLFVVDRGAPTSGELEARKNNLLHVFRRDQVDEIVVETPDGKARLTRTPATDASEERWSLAVGNAPALDADDAAVDRLVQSLEFATPVRKIDPPLETSITGLDKPRVTVSIRMGKLQSRIAVGKEAPSPTGAAYVSVDGEGVFVLPRDVAADLLAPPDKYRARTLSPWGITEMASIALDGAGGSRTIVRAPWGGFRLDGDAGPRVNRIAFDLVQQAIGGLRAERFIPDAAADAALGAAKEKLSIELRSTDASKPVFKLEIGGECPAAGDAAAPEKGARLIVVARRAPDRMSACAPEAVFDGLRTTREALVDKHVLDLRNDDIEELLIQRGDRKLELVRKGTGWKLRHPEERDVTAADSKGFVDGLLKLEGELAPEAQVVADGSLRVIQPASGSQTHPEQKVSLGAAKGDEVLVKREQDGVVLKLSRNQARLLDPVTTFLRSTELVDLSPERIRRVATSWGDDKQVIARTAEGFRLETPAGFAADGSMSSDLFETLAKLAADRWVAERDDGSFGLDKPRVTAQFEATDDGGVRSWKLLIGARAGDGAYARWEPDNGVFVLQRSVEEELATFAIDRSPFIVDHAEVERMTISGSGKTVVLTGKTGGDLEGPGADRIQDAFLQMRAEAVVKVGDWDQQPVLTIDVKRRPGHGERSKDIHIEIGKGDVWRTMSVHYARRSGWNATYVIAASRLKPILEQLGTRD